MKRIMFLLLILISSLAYGQVITTKIVKIPNATLSFVSNIPAFSKIINQSNYKEYLTLLPLSGIKSLSTCILGTDIIESGLGSYKYSNDSTGTTSGYVNLARFYSTILSINNSKQNNLGFTPYNSTNPSGYISTESDPTISSWAKDSVKPDYTKSEIGLDSVLNHKQWYSGWHPTTPIEYGLPDYPITLPASDVYTWAKQPLKPSYTKAEVGLSNVTNNTQWYSGNHPTIFADYGLTGGVLTSDLSGTSLSMVAPINVASLSGWTFNNDTCTIYGTNAIGYLGDNRKIFRAGIYLGSNGFTVDWRHSTTKFAYQFNDGIVTLTDVTVLGGFLSAPTGLTGGIYYNTTDKHFYGFNETIWTRLDN